MSVELINKVAQLYAEHYSSSMDDLASEVATETLSSHPQAHMLSGHLQGKFLELISILSRPKYILEIGTFTGYSALCLAKGLVEDGELHTIELRSDEVSTAKKNFLKSSYRDRIILHEGNALELIPGIIRPWDLVFIDADKVGYIDYFNLILPMVKSGGLILADNVLFHGEVLTEPVTGKSARAIQAFNDHVHNDKRVENVLLTIRDGLMLMVKK